MKDDVVITGTFHFSFDDMLDGIRWEDVIVDVARENGIDVSDDVAAAAARAIEARIRNPFPSHRLQGLDDECGQGLGIEHERTIASLRSGSSGTHGDGCD